MSASCLVCGGDRIAAVLDVGPQPVGNRFLKAPNDAEELFPIALQQCEACGLMQIEQPLPARALVPPFDWITYDEPEGHLDTLAGILFSLPGVGSGSVAAGISFKDDSTLQRLERMGMQTWRLDIERDLGAAGVAPGYGVETIQDRLTAATARSALRNHKAPQILVVRHILEHASNPLDFVQSLRQLVAPGGYIVIEVPDCTRSMQVCDYSMLWEEHVLYFTSETFGNSLVASGMDLVRMETYPYPFENSLVAIARAGASGAGARPALAAVAEERARGAHFGNSFAQYKEKVGGYLDDARRAGPVALLGAGHLACTWIGLMDAASQIDFVVDDNPNKRGLYMPGSKLPIVGSEALLERKVALCLLGVNPISEQKVIERNAGFRENGGVFASIFPGSASGLRL